jgi:colanic acid biosynthesis glycosyl transferase WcaI
MIRTLLLIIQFPPDVNSTGILMSQVARGLSTRGHQVSVITSFPHYEQFQVWDAYRGKWKERTHEKGLDVTRVNVFANGKKQNMTYRLLICRSMPLPRQLIYCVAKNTTSYSARMVRSLQG